MAQLCEASRCTIGRYYAGIENCSFLRFSTQQGCRNFRLMKFSELTLYTRNLKQQKRFYGEVLGFPCIEASENRIVFRAGWSRLVFESAKTCNPVHYALLIPGDSFLAARDWLSERVEHLTYEGEEIIDFPNWNARSQYFYDEDRNIVEFIARRDVAGTLRGNFSADSITGIGEIGLPASDLEELYQTLNTLKTLPKYSGDFRRFGAAGDPDGLFILVNPELKDWFPSGDPVHPAHLRVRGDLNFDFYDQKITGIKL